MRIALNHMSSASAAAPFVAGGCASDDSAAVIYSCRRCRAALFRGSQLSTHELGAHAFAAHRAAKDARAGAAGAGAVAAAAAAAAAAADASAACSSLFLVEPVKWMAGSAGGAAAEGKLACPGGCGARVGTLSWAGSQCSCGTWVTPAIQFSKKALDTRHVLTAAAALPAHAVPPTLPPPPP